ncbi:MAG: 30S ribosomal protein S8e [Methanomethylophilus sp.]|jgi:small subunit ribosomal protein S8e
MALWQGKSNRKSTGGRLILARSKRKFEISREQQYTRIGNESLKQYRGLGGSKKVGVLYAEYANVVDKKTNTVKRAKIISVTDNPSDRNLVQRNILNKGAKIKTDLGEAVVTSRPGQSGVVNAVLVE